MRDWSRVTAVSAAAAHVGWSLMLHADDDGEARPSVGTIAAECHVDRNTARRALRELEAAGEIVAKETKQNAPTVYRLTYLPAQDARPRNVRARIDASARAQSEPCARAGCAPKLEEKLERRGPAGATTDERGTHLPGSGWLDRIADEAAKAAPDEPDPPRNVAGARAGHDALTAARAESRRP